ncbi:MAG TPA: hypothetical protein VKD26_05360, partial [Streptosporangiaceae bacterium]|nr:hypothetical protein [Streptosporangiaceae bacterium]
VPARAVLSRLSGRAGGAVTAAAAVLALTVALVSGAGAAAAAASPVHDHHGPSARPKPAVHTPGAPGAGQPPAHRGRTDPGCRVRIDDVRIAGYLGSGRVIRAAVVGAYVACRLTVHHMSLQVTLWKAGLLYDHEQAQTTVAAVAGSRLGSDVTRVTCRDQTTSRFYGVAHAVVYFDGRRGDAWVKSPGTSAPRCGT